MAECLKQHASRLIITDDSHRQNVDAQIREIVDCVRAAAGNDAAFAMLQDQDRSLARDPRDLAKNEFVGHQIAEDSDRHLWERFDDLPQATAQLFGLFGMLIHRVSDLRSRLHSLGETTSSTAGVTTVPTTGSDFLTPGVFGPRSCEHGIHSVSRVGEFHFHGNDCQRLRARQISAQIDRILFGGDESVRLRCAAAAQQSRISFSLYAW